MWLILDIFYEKEFMTLDNWLNEEGVGKKVKDGCKKLQFDIVAGDVISYLWSTE